MALEWYLTLGGVEIANSARLEAYTGSVGSGLESLTPCGCPTLTAELVGDGEEYTTPEEDRAPWWDPDVPASADFAGLMVLSVEGLDDYPVSRTVTQGVTGGGIAGRAVVGPRTITVTGLLLGGTCCAVAYGLRWLSEALSGCGDDGCAGDCLGLYSCCPSEEDAADPVEWARGAARQLRRVSLVDGPRVIERVGGGCGASDGCGSSGADVLRVEFVLSAGVPWAWTHPVPVLDVPVPGAGAEDECVTWCVHRPPDPPVPQVCVELSDDCPGLGAPAVEGAACSGLEWPVLDEPPVDPCEEPCRLAACPDESETCGDPSCRPPAPPTPPAPATCWCVALAAESATYELDLSEWPAHFGAAPIIEVFAGGEELRRVTVTLYAREDRHEGMSCEEVAREERCNAAAQWEIGYVPAGGTVTVDGQAQRAWVECGGRCEVSTESYGPGGGPLEWPLLRCAAYCVLVEADAMVTPAEDARVRVSLSGREY